MGKKRAKGATFISIFYLCTGILLFYFFLYIAITQRTFNFVHLAFATVATILGYFILKLKNWARVIAIMWTIITIFIGLLLIITEKINPIIPVTRTIPHLIIMYYLTRPKVKEQFK